MVRGSSYLGFRVAPGGAPGEGGAGGGWGVQATEAGCSPLGAK